MERGVSSKNVEFIRTDLQGISFSVFQRDVI